MNKPAQLVLAQFFEEILERQLALDAAKHRLQEMEGFGFQSLFQKVSAGSEAITIRQLQSYFNGRGHPLSELQAYTLLFYFDGDRNYQINQHQFQRELLSRHRLKSVANQSEPPAQLPRQVEQAFVGLMLLYIDRQRILDVCRDELVWTQPWRLYDGVATLRLGYLTSLEIYLFLERNGITLCQAQLNYLVEGLHPQGRHKITVEAFCEMVRPQECNYYECYQLALSSFSEQMSAENNIVAETILLRERLEREGRVREGNRSRRRILAVVQENMETENFLQRRIEEAVEKQHRHLQRNELDLEREARKAMQVKLDQQRCAYPISSPVREHRAQEPSQRHSLSKCSSRNFAQPNLIYNVRNSSATHFSRKGTKIGSSLGRSRQSTARTGTGDTARSKHGLQLSSTPRGQPKRRRAYEFGV